MSAGAVVLFLRVWHPAEVYAEERERELAGVGARGSQVAGSGPGDGVPDGGGAAPAGDDDVVDPPREVARAYAPYLVIIAVFAHRADHRR